MGRTTKRVCESTIFDNKYFKTASQYTPDVVRALLRSMLEVEFKDRMRSRKSLLKLFGTAKGHAKSDGIERSADWMKVQILGVLRNHYPSKWTCFQTQKQSVNQHFH